MSVGDYYAKYWARANPDLATEPTTMRRRKALILDALKAHGALSPPTRVLDAGCGAGEFLAFFAEQGLDTYGVDLAPEALERAKTLCPGASLHVGSLDNPLPFAPDFFDAVWCTEVLEHLFLPAAALGEFYRVLRPGGLLLATMPYHGLAKNLAILAMGFEKHFDVSGPHIRFFTRRSLTDCLAGTGFEVLHWHGLGRMWPLYKSFFVVARKPVGTWGVGNGAAANAGISR